MAAAEQLAAAYQTVYPELFLVNNVHRNTSYNTALFRSGHMAFDRKHNACTVRIET
jgi:hypothetical protein